MAEKEETGLQNSGSIDQDTSILRERPTMASKDSSQDMIDLKEILEQRQSTHGPFSVQANLATVLKKTYRENSKECNDPVILEALDMIFHKIARIGSGNPYLKDHWVDIQGYAALPPKFRVMK